MKKNQKQIAKMAEVRKQKIQLIRLLQQQKKLTPEMEKKLGSMKGLRW